MNGFIIGMAADWYLRNKQKHTIADKSPDANSKPIAADVADMKAKEKQAEYRPLVVSFVKYLNKSLLTDNSPMITYWDFVGSSTDEIRFQMLGTDHSAVYIGRLTYAYDNSCPRVDMLTYKNCFGQELIVLGERFKDFTLDQVLKSLRIDKQDPRKIAYLGLKTSEALKNGSALFSVCDYESIREEDFEKVFGDVEIDAYCAMLEEEDFITERLEGDKIRLTPCEDPAM